MLKRKLLAQKDHSTDATQFLKRYEEMLAEECYKHIGNVLSSTRDLAHGWESRVQDEVGFIMNVCKGREALRSAISRFEVPSPTQTESKILRLQVSSLFLCDCWIYLTSDPAHNERLHLVTGTIADGIRVLSQMEKIKLDKQSPAYVKADDVDAHMKIIALSEEHGHPLLAMFHSHMSKGMHATTPSAIDTSYQNRMVKIGCEAIGGIFSLDGFVRFFSTWKEFEIEVFGKGVQRVHDEPKVKVFQLLNAKQGANNEA